MGIIAPAKRVVIRAARMCFPCFTEKLLTRRLYTRVAVNTEAFHLPFLNWGYAPLNETMQVPELTAEEEPYRYSVQLYCHLIGDIDLSNKDVLEVGSGRGGGCNLIRRHFKARSVVGLDLSKQNVRLSSRDFGTDNVSFRQGDAEAMPFSDESFDAVVNVESSHCYPTVERFFRETKRVLRPGGKFFFADFRRAGAGNKNISQLLDELERSGLQLLRKEDITANVVESLRRSSDSVAARLRQYARNDEEYSWLAMHYHIVGTTGYARLQDGQEVYMSFLLKKPE